MGATLEPTGPDFAIGIPDLDDGGMLQGQYEHQAVIAVRRGSDYFVMAAACAHWGENLADGVVIGDTIRCPHHHACFSVRTGEAACPPALGPIQTFKVEKRGSGRVVSGRTEQVTAHSISGGPSSVVIVGGGAAGSACALTLRGEGYTGPIVLISSDQDLPCDRPNVSKDYLAGNAPEEWLFLRDVDSWKAVDVEVRLGTTVTSIDRAAKSVTMANGDTVSYGALLLATGADAIRLPLPGADLPHVHVLRTVADGRQILAGIKGAKSAVVIGSSFIGMEAAASLKARGTRCARGLARRRAVHQGIGAGCRRSSPRRAPGERRRIPSGQEAGVDRPDRGRARRRFQDSCAAGGDGRRCAALAVAGGGRWPEGRSRRGR